MYDYLILQKKYYFNKFIKLINPYEFKKKPNVFIYLPYWIIPYQILLFHRSTNQIL